MSYKRNDFPEDFLWGVSTSSYQIEGATDIDGRGPSIWDTFSHTPGKVKHGDTGDIATDHYHRLEEDLDLLVRLGVKVYRFSISWSRIQPDGMGATNEKGLQFYDRLIDGLIARGITPVPTLYHWDLPEALQQKGGWANREIVDHFASYAEIAGKRWGDKAKMWTTINEPWVVTYLGYALGIFAPGISDFKVAAAVHHHLLLAHARGMAVLRDSVADAQVGIALNMSHIYPAIDSELSREAADVAFNQLVESYMLPLRQGKYPTNVKDFSDWWQVGAGIVETGDLDEIKNPIDFLSINEYHPRYVVAGEDLAEVQLAGYYQEMSPLLAIGQPFIDVTPPGAKKTNMGWIIEPNGLRDLLIEVGKRWPGLPLYISENGSSGADYRGTDGHVVDDERVAYLVGHINAVHEAIAAGVNLRGYFLWSFLDNFEWADGYSQRFGIVFVDFPTGERVPKKSYGWYQDVVAHNSVPAE